MTEDYRKNPKSTYARKKEFLRIHGGVASDYPDQPWNKED
jgi:hypothetical protein